MDFHQYEFQIFLQNSVSVIAFLSVILCFGTLGNLHVLLIYLRNYQRSSVKVFITAMASTDLTMCLLTVPVFIFDNRRMLTYVGDGICQLSRFVTVALTLSSLFIQTFIAVDRFKKVCKPLRRQWTPKKVTIAIFLILIFSIVISIPTLVIFGKVHQNYTLTLGPIWANGTSPLEGYTCGAKDRFANFYHAAGVLLLITVSLITVIVLYSLIVREIVKRKNISRAFGFRSYIGHRASVVSTIGEETISQDQWSAENPQGGTFTQDNQMIRIKHRDKKMERASRTSVMFMLVFIFSYIWLLPIIAFNIIRATNEAQFKFLREKLGQFMEIILFGGLINNIVNPVVYLCVDEKFRYYLKNCHTEILKRCKHRKNGF